MGYHDRLSFTILPEFESNKMTQITNKMIWNSSNLVKTKNNLQKLFLTQIFSISSAPIFLFKMNRRCCQHPICFTYDDENSSSSEINRSNFLPKVSTASSASTISEILANSGYKCAYHKDKNDPAEIYVTCNILEKTFHLGCSLINTVRMVKYHIKRLENIPVDLLHVFLDGKILRDEMTLEECGVKNKSALVLGIKLHTACCKKCKKKYEWPNNDQSFDVTLRSLTGNIYDVSSLSQLSFIEDLKEAIEEKYKVYPDNQMVIFRGKKLEDDVTLLECGVRKSSASDLFLLLYRFEHCSFCSNCAHALKQPTISLIFFKHKVVCVLNPEHTIRKLKELSYRYLHHIHPDLQQMTLKTHNLQDDKTLEECDVKDGCILQVRLRFDQRRCDKCNGDLD